MNKGGKSALICGLAPCLMDDFLEARKHLPDADIILVNYSCYELEGDYLFTIHPEQLTQMKEKCLTKDIPTMSTRKGADMKFEDTGFCGATSGYAAARVAVDYMGYDEVVMCGCPIDPEVNGYYGKFYKNWKYHTNSLPNYAKILHKYAAERDNSKIRSMSGLTRKLFGVPEWLQTSQSVQTH
jgi:hypothetical protein